MARVAKRGREWSRKQVAQYLGIGEDAATRLMEIGAIHADLRGGEWRTIREACDVYLYRKYLTHEDVVLLSILKKVRDEQSEPDEWSSAGDNGKDDSR